MDRTAGTAFTEPDETAAERNVYLSRCQVDTPERIVRFVWELVNTLRPNAGKVVDYGCGDARFNGFGHFESYQGFEIDPKRGPVLPLEPRSSVSFKCAFERDNPINFATCVGNPPYVRHHDLEPAWLERAEERLSSLVKYKADGRGNAYVYFLWLALASVADDGLVALVIPYEWVSRPASAKVREFIRNSGWDVDVYHIENAAFERVLTTACVAVIDKRAPRGGAWQLFNVSGDDVVTDVKQATGSSHKQLAYEKALNGARAIRGLSPGGKEAFVLTEGERIHYQLKRGTDVLPAVTSFRYLDQTQSTLTETLFRNRFINTGQRCWLLNVANKPSSKLAAYLAQVPDYIRSNYTCTARAVWWQFAMPKVADILYASGFKDTGPKMFRNTVGAVHVGGIHGIHCETSAIEDEVFQALRTVNFSEKVVPLSKGFLKVEVKQMNAVLNEILERSRTLE